MVNLITREVLLTSAVAAIIWGLTHYFIRLGLNPETVDLPSKRQDAFYGVLAVFAAGILSTVVRGRLGL